MQVVHANRKPTRRKTHFHMFIISNSSINVECELAENRAYILKV